MQRVAVTREPAKNRQSDYAPPYPRCVVRLTCRWQPARQSSSPRRRHPAFAWVGCWQQMRVLDLSTRSRSVSLRPNGLLDEEHTGTVFLPAESTTTSENHGTLVGEDDLAGDLVDRLYHARHVCSFALSKPASSVSGCRPRQTSSFMLTLSRTSSSLGRFTRVPEVGIGP
jgi:hypothetical protein